MSYNFDFGLSRRNHDPYRPSRQAALLLVAAVALHQYALMSAPKDQTAWIDCQQEPQGSVDVKIDIRQATIAAVGDAHTTVGHEIAWRERYEIDNKGTGEFTIAIGGLGMPYNYAEVVSEIGWSTLENVVSGSELTVSAPKVKETYSSAPIVITYSC